MDGSDIAAEVDGKPSEVEDRLGRPPDEQILVSPPLAFDLPTSNPIASDQLPAYGEASRGRRRRRSERDQELEAGPEPTGDDGVDRGGVGGGRTEKGEQVGGSGLGDRR